MQQRREELQRHGSRMQALPAFLQGRLDLLARAVVS
jgi:hypothetical protein